MATTHMHTQRGGRWVGSLLRNSFNWTENWQRNGAGIPGQGTTCAKAWGTQEAVPGPKASFGKAPKAARLSQGSRERE
jgi:hypothetical protein